MCSAEISTDIPLHTSMGGGGGYKNPCANVVLMMIILIFVMRCIIYVPAL